MQIVSGSAAERIVKRLAARGSKLDRLEAPVRRIVEGVRCGGDRALRRYAGRWDGLAAAQSVRVEESEMTTAWRSLNREMQRSLKQAAHNIRQFCTWQKPSSWMRSRGGASLGVVVRPLQSVGCYVPGGRHPLFSTLLMTVIPAQAAGVKNIRVVSPKPSPEVLAAAGMLGVKEFYRVGGAQAVAALAYGTTSIPRVDKIVGPGNAYVTVAKKLVAFDCAIDFLAGPTECAVLSELGNPKFIAADLVAQAEHDPDALAVFITTSTRLARAVAAKVCQLAQGNTTAKESLRRHGVILLAESRAEAREWANRLAPEHITADAEDVPFILNAGSIFVGDYSAQAAGDYASGPNHVLPTGGQARFRGGLGVVDFVKIITVQRFGREGFRKIALAVERLASAEGLTAHAESVRVRCGHA